jgi:putative transposase
MPLEGVSHHGRAAAIRRAPAGRGADDIALHGVRHLPEDRLYKIYERYKAFGLHGLNDRSRRAQRQANRLPLTIERAILGLKKRHPSWGAPKIREKLRPQCAPVRCPAMSTVHAVLDRHGLVRKRRQRRPHLHGTPLSRASEPNALWCADFKGEFLLEDHRYCYPLTITDFAGRYLLGCEALESTRELTAFPVFERVFQEFGLPDAIRTPITACPSPPPGRSMA